MKREPKSRSVILNLDEFHWSSIKNLTRLPDSLRPPVRPFDGPVSALAIKIRLVEERPCADCRADSAGPRMGFYVRPTDVDYFYWLCCNCFGKYDSRMWGAGIRFGTWIETNAHWNFYRARLEERVKTQRRLRAWATHEWTRYANTFKL